MYLRSTNQFPKYHQNVMGILIIYDSLTDFLIIFDDLQRKNSSFFLLFFIQFSSFFLNFSDFLRYLGHRK